LTDGIQPHLRCSCEAVALSDLGLIRSDEVVARILFNPQHIKADGTVRSGLFSPTDIRKRGVFLVRPAHLTPEALTNLAKAIVANYHKPRTAEGVIQCKAERLRAIVDAEGERLLCLFDDPVNPPYSPHVVFDVAGRA
jgi:hypothetical protein